MNQNLTQTQCMFTKLSRIKNLNLLFVPMYFFLYFLLSLVINMYVLTLLNISQAVFLCRHCGLVQKQYEMLSSHLPMLQSPFVHLCRGRF